MQAGEPMQAKNLQPIFQKNFSTRFASSTAIKSSCLSAICFEREINIGGGGPGNGFPASTHQNYTAEILKLLHIGLLKISPKNLRAFAV